MQDRALRQKILFIKDVEQIIGRNRLTLRRWWTKDKFPKPVKLNDTVLSWYYEDIEQWINLKMVVRDFSFNN